MPAPKMSLELRVLEAQRVGVLCDRREHVSRPPAHMPDADAGTRRFALGERRDAVAALGCLLLGCCRGHACICRMGVSNRTHRDTQQD